MPNSFFIPKQDLVRNQDFILTQNEMVEQDAEFEKNTVITQQQQQKPKEEKVIEKNVFQVLQDCKIQSLFVEGRFKENQVPQCYEFQYCPEIYQIVSVDRRMPRRLSPKGYDCIDREEDVLGWQEIPTLPTMRFLMLNQISDKVMKKVLHETVASDTLFQLHLIIHPAFECSNLSGEEKLLQKLDALQTFHITYPKRTEKVLKDFESLCHVFGNFLGSLSIEFLKFPRESCSSSVLAIMLKECKILRSLSLHRVPVANQWLENVLERYPTLRSLEIKHCHYESKPEIESVENVDDNEEVLVDEEHGRDNPEQAEDSQVNESLNESSISVLSNIDPNLFILPRAHENLRNVFIQFCNAFNDQILCTLCKNCPRIVELFISGTKVTRKSLCIISEYLPELEDLTLTGPNFGNEEGIPENMPEIIEVLPEKKPKKKAEVVASDDPSSPPKKKKKKKKKLKKKKPKPVLELKYPPKKHYKRMVVYPMNQLRKLSVNWSDFNLNSLLSLAFAFPKVERFNIGSDENKVSSVVPEYEAAIGKDILKHHVNFEAYIHCHIEDIFRHIIGPDRDNLLLNTRKSMIHSEKTFCGNKTMMEKIFNTLRSICHKEYAVSPVRKSIPWIVCPESPKTVLPKKKGKKKKGKKVSIHSSN